MEGENQLNNPLRPSDRFPDHILKKASRSEEAFNPLLFIKPTQINLPKVYQPTPQNQ